LLSVITLVHGANGFSLAFDCGACVLGVYTDDPVGDSWTAGCPHAVAFGLTAYHVKTADSQGAAILEEER
jgi:hypothetical protein